MIQVKKAAGKKLSLTQKVRLIIQISVVVFIFFVSISHYLEENEILVIPGTASIHAICPFGGVVTLYTYASTGDYIQKIHQSDFYMLLGLLIALVLTGAGFCGWICPLGSIQEWFGKLGRKIFGRYYNKIPKKLDFILRFGKYILLIWVIIQTARTGKLFFGDFDPYYNLFNIWTDEIALTGYISVALTLGLSLFIERPFCRYACPLGAINGFFNSFSLFSIKRKKKTCVNCGLCDLSCPMNVNISGKGAIKSPACIRCMKCTEVCPENTPVNVTLEANFILDIPSKKKRLFPRTGIGVIAVLAFFIPVVISVAAGTFITERVRTYETTSDIRGSSTIQEIVDNYDITRGLLYNSFAIPAEVSSETKLKDLSELLGIPEEAEIISPETIREAVDYINVSLKSLDEIVSIETEEFREIINEYLLDESASLKQLMAKSEPGTVAFIFSGKWPEVQIENGLLLELPEDHEKIEEGGVEIKGSTTLGDISNMVDDFDNFLLTMVIPIDENMSSTLKDLKNIYNFEMQTVRDYIEENRK